jgi:adenylosuccinate lyase
MATENVLMAGVQRGGDRQDLHERIRRHSHSAGEQVKMHGLPNDLIARLKGDEAFTGIDIDAVLDPRDFVGRAPEQVDEFIAECVEPARAKYRAVLGHKADLKV